ncbi:MAG: DUF3006 family protein [Selenomonadaceae bacterium]|nr:DUF3006 family protein [Selenomonadaceae bacterium]
MDSREEKEFKKISVYLDRIEELEDDSAEAVLLVDEGGEEYSGELVLPAKFLPEDVGEGDYLILTLTRDEEKTNAALDTARNILKELEE